MNCANMVVGILHMEACSKTMLNLTLYLERLKLQERIMQYLILKILQKQIDFVFHKAYLMFY